MVSVVVTGAAGHVGGNLVRALLARGRPVRVLVYQDWRAIEGLGLEFVQGDVCDLASLRHAFAGAEVVYHAAGYISLLRSEWPRLNQVNINGTRNVVQACLDCGVRRLVHFSSIHALEREPLNVPVDEDRPLVNSRRYPPYDRSKAASEREVCWGIAQGLDAIVLNPTAIIGPHDYKPSPFGAVLLALGRGRLPALVEGGFDWVDVRDVVMGALRAEERAPAGSKYLLSGHWVSLQDIAAMASKMTGTRPPRFVCSMGLARLGAPFATAFAQLVGRRPLFTSVSLEELRSNPRVSHARATRDLAYQPRPFEETLRDTYQWFAETGRLACP